MDAINENRFTVICDSDYKEYMEATTTGIVYLDGQKRIRNINAEAERICFLQRHSILGKKAEEVFSDFGKKFLQVFSGEEQRDVHSTTIRVRINEQHVYLHVNILKIIGNSGEVTGNVLIMQDVSAVRAALKQIQTTKMLTSLGELAAGVAHHVRTPLTTISGYLQLMLGRLEDDKYTVKRDVLENLLGEVSYINDVVKELVLFAKPAITKRPGVDINRILAEALLMTFHDLGQEKITINRQIVKELPTINADANFLQQALVNILQNAFEAMGDEGVLTVKTWRDSDINMLVISITDSGAGIAQDILPRVFEPFYTTKIDRMGLGLPIAYRIVSEHGGFINLSLSTSETSGTRVHIYLPIWEEKANYTSLVQQQVLNLQ